MVYFAFYLHFYSLRLHTNAAPLFSQSDLSLSEPSSHISFSSTLFQSAVIKWQLHIQKLIFNMHHLLTYSQRLSVNIFWGVLITVWRGIYRWSASLWGFTLKLDLFRLFSSTLSRCFMHWHVSLEPQAKRGLTMYFNISLFICNPLKKERNKGSPSYPNTTKWGEESRMRWMRWGQIICWGDTFQRLSYGWGESSTLRKQG